MQKGKVVKERDENCWRFVEQAVAEIAALKKPPGLPTMRRRVSYRLPAARMSAEARTWNNVVNRAFLCCLVVTSSAATAPAQVFDGPGGKGKIEFLGLKRQKPKEVLDRLAALAPGKPVHACAAELKSKLGFADAAVILHFGEDKQMYIVVTLAEPEDVGRVKYRPAMPASDSAVLVPWPDGKMIAANPAVLQSATFSYLNLQKGRPDEARKVVEQTFEMKAEVVRPAWEFLQRHADRKDFDLATWTLSHHGDPRMRALAAAVLMNFHNLDAAWWHLADALRDPDQHVGFTAQQVISTLAKECPRTVDWAPAAPTLRHVLAGTNLFAYAAFLEILTTTKVSANLTDEIIPAGADLLVAHVRAEHKLSRAKAVAFLRQIGGGNERSTAEWLEWLDRHSKKN